MALGTANGLGAGLSRHACDRTIRHADLGRPKPVSVLPVLNRMAMNLRPAEEIGTIPGAQTASGIYLYLVVFAVASTLLVSTFLAWGLRGYDHFASYPLNGDA